MNDDAKRIATAIKTIAFWSNRANDAYAMGEADWVHPPPTRASFLIKLAAVAVEIRGNSADGWEQAAKAVEGECKFRGIDPARHRWRPA